MGRTRVKICGITRPEDAAMAARLGADAIGIVFHPGSRRNVSIAQAKRIAAAAGPFVTIVGVFVDAPVKTIARVARAVGFQAVQMHGSQSPADVIDAASRGLRVLKTFRVDEQLNGQLQVWRRAMPRLRGALMGIVLETGKTDLPGGSGVPNDFQAIRRHMRLGHFRGLPPLIIAGGLSPSNVGPVVRSLRPWAVDVSSGVEAAPGRKSPGKLRAFLRAVHSGG